MILITRVRARVILNYNYDYVIRIIIYSARVCAYARALDAIISSEDVREYGEHTLPPM